MCQRLYYYIFLYHSDERSKGANIIFGRLDLRYFAVSVFTSKIIIFAKMSSFCLRLFNKISKYFFLEFAFK